jgi:hypothetical protein
LLTPLSFRDPAGRVYAAGERIMRCVQGPHAAWTERFLETPFFRKSLEAGIFPATARAAPPAEAKDAAAALWLEHERIDLPAYPHEWIPDQLFAAGLLTIDLAIEAAGAGLEMKDATPYNVLFSRGRGVFCDVLSFVDRTAGELWLPYGQFQRTFILPLYMHRRFGLPPHRLFLDKRDGLEPAEVYPAVPWYRALMPLELQLVTLPALLTKRGASKAATLAAAKQGTPSARSNFVFLRSLARLRSQLLAVRPRQVSESTWGDYEGECAHYSSAERERKHSFVREAIERTRPARVLDLGANAGEYSRIAVAGGARHVVAADADINALQALYRRNDTERLPITPFVLNLARPTPAVGWRNTEHPSFLERARGRFDTVLALAVMHHMLVSERVPLEDFIAFLADLEPRHLVLEWVSPKDEKFRQIAGPNLGLYADLDEARLRKALAGRFRVLSEASIGDGRRLLLHCSST